MEVAAAKLWCAARKHTPWKRIVLMQIRSEIFQQKLITSTFLYSITHINRPWCSTSSLDPQHSVSFNAGSMLTSISTSTMALLDFDFL